MDLISVILPAYNAEGNILKCCDSILSNITSGGGYFIDIQLIVINDGSIDNTLSIIKAHYEDNPRVVILDQNNQGVAAAREHGMQYVRGDYIAFCDSDDWVDEDWLISMYTALKRHNADIISFRAKIPERNIVLNSDEYISWDRQAAIREFLIHKKLNGTLCTKLFKSELFVGLHFNAKLKCFEDGDIIWRILQRVNKVVKVNDAKYNWIVSDTSLSNGCINEERLDSSLLFLNTLVASTKSMGDEYRELAGRMQKRWLYSDIKQMYKYGLRIPEIEGRILNVLRNHPIHTLKLQEDLQNKIFVFLVMVMPFLARIVRRKYFNLK